MSIDEEYTDLRVHSSWKMISEAWIYQVMEISMSVDEAFTDFIAHPYWISFCEVCYKQDEFRNEWSMLKLVNNGIIWRIIVGQWDSYGPQRTFLLRNNLVVNNWGYLNKYCPLMRKIRTSDDIPLEKWSLKILFIERWRYQCRSMRHLRTT